MEKWCIILSKVLNDSSNKTLLDLITFYYPTDFFVIENREWIYLMCPSGQCWSKNCIKKILIVKQILQSPINSCSQPVSQELFIGCRCVQSQDLPHGTWQSSWHVGRWFWSTNNSHDIIIFALVELRNPGSIITLLSNQNYTFPPWISDFPQALARSKDVFWCAFHLYIFYAWRLNTAYEKWLFSSFHSLSKLQASGPLK